MADKQTRRLSLKKLSANDTAFAALQAITGYTPANKDYSLTNGSAFASAMKSARDAEAQAASAAKAARDNAVAAEWNMHNYMLGAKDQIAAQYGKSSNEFQSVGMKKKSEYKKPTKKAAKKSA